MEVIKSIVEKLKLNELAVLLLIASLILTFLPEKQIIIMGLMGVRQYQMYISLLLIITLSYFTMIAIFNITKYTRNKFFGIEKRGIHYMKKNMSPEEMDLLKRVFYDSRKNLFNTSGTIELNDGLKAGLENKHVIYQASDLSTFYTEFPYNLQPYAREFLNKNLKNGNINIQSDPVEYRLL